MKKNSESKSDDVNDDCLVKNNSDDDDDDSDCNIFSLRINKKYLSEKFYTSVQECLNGNSKDSVPFPHFMLNEFVDCDDLSMLEKLRDELDSIFWQISSNDLYELKQINVLDSEAINCDNFPAIFSFRDFLYNNVREWLIDITGVQLSEHVTINGSKYCYTDVLLPHDDLMDQRVFAYVFYLTPNWIKEYGGSLQLYESDSTGTNITKLSKSIVPLKNSFIFFRVQHNSWHSVEEVLVDGQERISINGWFHYSKITKTDSLPKSIVSSRYMSYSDFNKSEIFDWINDIYNDTRNITNIFFKFTSNREIMLPNFLNQEKYEKVLHELQTEKNFRTVGPLNRRNYKIFDENFINKKSELAKMIRFFRSDSFFYLISRMTSIQLYREHYWKVNKPANKRKKMENESENPGPSYSLPDLDVEDEIIGKDVIEIRSRICRFEAGSYTLVDDQIYGNNENESCWIDVNLCLNSAPNEWPDNFGGYTSYFNKEDSTEDEFVRVPVLSNSLSIVMCEPSFYSFTKYVNSRAQNSFFFNFISSLYPIQCENDFPVEDYEE